MLARVIDALRFDALGCDSILASNINNSITEKRSKMIRFPHLLIVLCFAAAVANHADAADPPKQTAPATAAANTPPEGFVALFNGKDLTGWKGLLKGPLDNPVERAKLTPEQHADAQKVADENMRQHWAVQDGVLVYDGKGRSLATAKDYGDFEMLVDWKILKDGDSGIYLRGSPQIQIWDPASKVAAGVGSGGLYNNEKGPSKPSKVADKPIGDWNTFWIKMVEDKVWVKLNDELVVDGVVMENYWERKANPDKPIFPTGQIELQNHRNPLYFRNIFIKELPAQK